MTSTARDTKILKRTIVCVQCKKAIDVRPADVLLYTASTWPECCGQMMRYDVPERAPITRVGMSSPLPTN